MSKKFLTGVVGAQPYSGGWILHKVCSEIDRHDATATMVGLQEELKRTSQSYLEASRIALRWLSLPEQANLEQAQAKLIEARDMLGELEGSQWLEKRSP